MLTLVNWVESSEKEGQWFASDKVKSKKRWTDSKGLLFFIF